MKAEDVILVKDNGKKVKFPAKYITPTAICLEFDRNSRRSKEKIATDANGKTFYTIQLSDDIAQSLADHIAASKNLTRVIISGQNFGDKGLEKLAAGLKANKSGIETFIVTDNADYYGVNRATKSGVLPLLAVANEKLNTEKKLRTIHLPEFINEKNEKQFVLYVKTESGHRMDISSQITDTSIELAFNRESHFNKRTLDAIREVPKDKNPEGYVYVKQLGDDAAEVLSNCIANSKTLKTVKISGENFGDNGLAILAKGLKANNSIESVTISDNRGYAERPVFHRYSNVTDSGIDPILAVVLAKNYKHVDLSQNIVNLTPKTRELIVAILEKKGAALETLNIEPGDVAPCIIQQNNHYKGSKKDLEDLVAIAKKNLTITELELPFRGQYMEYLDDTCKDKYYNGVDLIRPVRYNEGRLEIQDHCRANKIAKAGIENIFLLSTFLPMDVARTLVSYAIALDNRHIEQYNETKLMSYEADRRPAAEILAERITERKAKSANNTNDTALHIEAQKGLAIEIKVEGINVENATSENALKCILDTTKKQKKFDIETASKGTTKIQRILEQNTTTAESTAGKKITEKEAPFLVLPVTDNHGMRVRYKYASPEVTRTSIDLTFKDSGNSSAIIEPYSNFRLDDDAAEEIGNYVAKSTTLKSLKLAKQAFSNAGFAAIARGLAINTSLESVTINNNYYHRYNENDRQIGACSILEQAAVKKYKHVDLCNNGSYCNHVTNEALINLLEKNKSLETLNLSSSHEFLYCSYNGMGRLTHGTSEEFDRANEELPQKNKQCLDNLVTAIKKHPNITEFKLPKINYPDGTAHAGVMGAYYMEAQAGGYNENFGMQDDINDHCAFNKTKKNAVFTLFVLKEVNTNTLNHNASDLLGNIVRNIVALNKNDIEKEKTHRTDERVAKSSRLKSLAEGKPAQGRG
jgi:hypothetical protein